MTKRSYKNGDIMPRDTFYNLPPDKRQRIEDAAVSEFTEFNYDSASINRIVEASGIAKGSFYQYFTDKKDLYFYLLSIIVEKKLSFLQPVMQNPSSLEFFQLLREIYAAGLRFASANPQLQKIGERLLADRNHPVFIEFIQKNTGKADEVFQMLLSQAIQRGEIRGDIDVRFIAHIISTLNTSIADYYQENVNSVIDEAYMETVEKMIDFLKQGLKSYPNRLQAEMRGNDAI